MKDGYVSLKKQNKFIAFIGLCFAVMLLSAFFLTLFGVIDLRITEQAVLHPVLEFAIRLIIFMLDMFFMFSICLRIFDKKIIKILIYYAPIHIIICLFPLPILFKSTVMPFLYVLLITLYNRCNLKDFCIRYAIFNIFIILYQQISLYVKISFFGLEYCYINAICLIIYSIDSLLLYTLCYLGVKRYVSRFNMVRSETESVSVDAESCEENLDVSGLKAHQSFIFWVLAIGYQVFQLIVVLAIGFINNAFVEILVMLAVFWLGRPILKQSWHSDTLTVCSAVTFSGFYILTKVTPPLSVSLFSCIALSALFVYILHRAGIHEDEYRNLKAYKQEREDFKTKTRRDKAKNVLKELSPYHIDYVMLKDYINGETLEVLADRYNLSQSTLNRKINALTRK